MTKHKAGGWDIRIQCTGCGRRQRRHRNDHPGKIGDNPQATLEEECYECESTTVHFIDFASPKELKND